MSPEASPYDLGAVQLTLAASLILINGLLSLWLGLGLEKRLLVAAFRTVVQLLIMGYVLLPVFRLNLIWLVLLVALVMIVIAAWESVRRLSRTYAGIRLATFVALLVGASSSTVFGTVAIIGAEPWWQPQYFIPLLGMILGNAITGASLGLDRVLQGLEEGRTRVEVLLSMGASWWEASRPIAAEAIRTAMIPIINTMSAVGLVVIPGMMTGQILGGTPPELAARYQIMIMFLLGSATALASTIAVLISVRALFDRQHRLRTDRLVPR